MIQRYCNEHIKVILFYGKSHVEAKERVEILESALLELEEKYSLAQAVVSILVKAEADYVCTKSRIGPWKKQFRKKMNKALDGCDAILELEVPYSNVTHTHSQKTLFYPEIRELIGGLSSLDDKQRTSLFNKLFSKKPVSDKEKFSIMKKLGIKRILEYQCRASIEMDDLLIELSGLKSKKARKYSLRQFLAIHEKEVDDLLKGKGMKSRDRNNMISDLFYGAGLEISKTYPSEMRKAISKVVNSK